MDENARSARRLLHFDRIEQAMADVEQLAIAQRDGKLWCVGKWTAGQNLGHLASWIDYAYDGFPLKIALWMRILFRPMKWFLLYRPMRAGAKIPGVPGGTLGTEAITPEQGVARFTASLKRLDKQAPPLPHPVFGPMTHAEWINLNLRHAELHLSFMRWD